MVSWSDAYDVKSVVYPHSGPISTYKYVHTNNGTGVITDQQVVQRPVLLNCILY